MLRRNNAVVSSQKDSNMKVVSKMVRLQRVLVYATWYTPTIAGMYKRFIFNKRCEYWMIKYINRLPARQRKKLFVAAWNKDIGRYQQMKLNSRKKD